MISGTHEVRGRTKRFSQRKHYLGISWGCKDVTIKSHGILLYQGRRPSLLQSLLQSFYLPKFLLNLPSLPFLTLTECDGAWFHWLHQFHWRLKCGFGWWNGYRSRHRGDTRSVLHIFSRFGVLFLGHPLSLLCTSSVVVTHTMAEIALLHDWCCHCLLFWEAPATAISMERGRAIKEPNFLAKITRRDHLKQKRLVFRLLVLRADVQNNTISVSKWDSNKAIQNIVMGYINWYRILSSNMIGCDSSDDGTWWSISNILRTETYWGLEALAVTLFWLYNLFLRKLHNMSFNCTKLAQGAYAWLHQKPAKKWIYASTVEDSKAAFKS